MYILPHERAWETTEVGQASRRFRLRISAADRVRLGWLEGHTAHATRSDVVREAIRFARHIASLECQGFVLYHRPAGVVTDLLPFPYRGDTHDNPPLAQERHNSGFLELRLDRAIQEDLAHIDARDPARSRSTQIRSSIGLYEAAVRAIDAGGSIHARGPGEADLVITVPGIGTPEVARSKVTRGTQPGSRLGILDGLPHSLTQAIHELARRENCAVETLLIDMLRTEVIARQDGHGAPHSTSLTDELFDWKPPIGPSENEQRNARSPSPEVNDAAAHTPTPQPSPQEWALVLAQDSKGTPQQLVVTPDKRIPLEPGDLALPAPEHPSEEPE